MRLPNGLMEAVFEYGGFVVPLAARAEELVRVEMAFEELEEEVRVMLGLHYGELKTQVEIAGEMGVALSRVKKGLKRGCMG